MKATLAAVKVENVVVVTCQPAIVMSYATDWETVVMIFWIFPVLIQVGTDEKCYRALGRKTINATSEVHSFSLPIIIVK